MSRIERVRRAHTHSWSRPYFKVGAGLQRGVLRGVFIHLVVDEEADLAHVLDLEARVRVDRDDLRAGGGVPGGGLTEVLDFSLRGRLQAPCIGTGLAFLALLLPLSAEPGRPRARSTRGARATSRDHGREDARSPIRWAPLGADAACRSIPRRCAARSRVAANAAHESSLVHGAHTRLTRSWIFLDNNIFRDQCG